MIGTTLFTLSKPLGKASIVAGSCVYFFVAFLCGWSALCLIKARNAHHDRLVAEGKPREQIKELLTFEGLAGQATGGAWGKTVFSFFLLASEVSFVIACSIAAASSLADVTAGFLPDTFGALSRAQLLLILMTLLLVPQCWVRKIKAGAAASSRPTSSSTPPSAPPARTQKIEINWYVPEDSGMSLVSIAGMSLYTAEYVNTILPIYEAHEKKENFTWLFVLCTSGVALLGWALSLTAYLNNPDSESTYCTHDLPPGAMKLVVQCCVTLGCFLTVPILFFVIPHFYEKTVFNKWLQMDNEYILAKQEEEIVKIDAGGVAGGGNDRREIVDTNADNVERRARGAEEKILTGQISALADRPTSELFHQGLPLYHKGQPLSDDKRQKLLNSRDEYSSDHHQVAGGGVEKSLVGDWNRNTGAWKNIYPTHELGKASEAAGGSGSGADADAGLFLGGGLFPQYHKLEQAWTTKPSLSEPGERTKIIHAYTVQLGNGRTKANGMPMEAPKIFAVLDPLDGYKSVREWWFNPSPVYDESGHKILTWNNPAQVGRLQAEWVDEEGNAVSPYEEDKDAGVVEMKKPEGGAPGAGKGAGLLLKQPQPRTQQVGSSGSGSGGSSRSSGSGRSSPSPEERSSTATDSNSPGQDGVAMVVDEDSSDDISPSASGDSPGSVETTTTSDSEDEKDHVAKKAQELPAAMNPPAGRGTASAPLFGLEPESKLILQKAKAVKLEWHWYHVSRKKRTNPLFTQAEEEIKGLDLLSDLPTSNPLHKSTPGYFVPWTYAVKTHPEVSVAQEMQRSDGAKRKKIKDRRGSKAEESEFAQPRFEPPIPGVDTFQDGAITFRGRVFTCSLKPNIEPESSYYWYSWILFNWFEKSNRISGGAAAAKTSCKWLPHVEKKKEKPSGPRGAQAQAHHQIPRKIAEHRSSLRQHHDQQPQAHPAQYLFRKRLHAGEYSQSDDATASRFWDAPSLKDLYSAAPTKRAKSTEAEEFLKEPQPFIWRKILYFNEVGRFTTSSGDDLLGALASSSLEALLLQKIRGKVPNPAALSAASAEVQSQVAVLDPKIATDVFTKTGIPAALRRVFVLDGVWNPWYASRELSNGGLQAMAYDRSGDAIFAHLKEIRLFRQPISCEFFDGPGGAAPASACASDALFVDSATAIQNFKSYGGRRFFKRLTEGTDGHLDLLEKSKLVDNFYGHSITATVMQLAQTLLTPPTVAGQNEAAFLDSVRALLTSSGLTDTGTAPCSRTRGSRNFGYLVSDGNYDWRAGPTQFHMFAGAGLVSRSLLSAVHQPLQSDHVKLLKAFQVEENFLCAPSVLCAELHGILFSLKALKDWLPASPPGKQHRTATYFGENEEMKSKSATSAVGSQGRLRGGHCKKRAQPLQQGDGDEDGGNDLKPTTRIPLLTDSSRAVELLRKYFKYGFQLHRSPFFHDVPEMNNKCNRLRADAKLSPAEANFKQAAVAARSSFLAGQKGLLAYRGMLRAIAEVWLNLLENEKVLVFFHWVPGHAGFLPNELVDSAAAKLRSEDDADEEVAQGRTSDLSPQHLGEGGSSEDNDGDGSAGAEQNEKLQQDFIRAVNAAINDAAELQGPQVQTFAQAVDRVLAWQKSSVEMMKRADVMLLFPFLQEHPEFADMAPELGLDLRHASNLVILWKYSDGVREFVDQVREHVKSTDGLELEQDLYPSCSELKHLQRENRV
eukprot:g1491.t1